MSNNYYYYFPFWIQRFSLDIKYVNMYHPHFHSSCLQWSYSLWFFQTIFTVSGKEDAANNFARGHYTVGKEVIDMVGWSFLEQLTYLPL